MRKIKRVLICILGFVILSVSCITANATSEIRSILGNENTDSNVDRMIEMKDILDVTLYRKQTDPTSGEVKYSEVSDIEHIYIKYYSNQFLARVQMKDLPDFYAPVKGCRIENNKCYLEIEYENVTQYTNDGQQQNKLEVLYGDVDGNYARSNSFSSLMSRIKANPYGTFVLTRDYDASAYIGDRTSLAGENFEFQGTIDGNGHTIYNLNGPLFDILDNATIKNLNLENIHLANEGAIGAGEKSTIKGAALANTAYDGTNILNVHVKDLTIITRWIGIKYGGIIGQAYGGDNEVTIKESSVTNLKIKGSAPQDSEDAQAGGIAGVIQETVIEDCYVEGSITGKNGVGGIVGAINERQPSGTSSTIKHNIAKVNINSSSGGAGGILGLGRSDVTLTQNISLSTGTGGKRIYGSGNVTLDGINIAISESTLNQNTESNINTISKNDLSSENLNQLGFSETKWNFNDFSYDNLPTLKNNDPRNTLEGELRSKNIYIPNYEILKQNADYNPNKQIAYSNLYKLMPFYDSKYLIIDGKKISEDHILNQKIINTVLAFDVNNEVMMYLTEENYDDIKSIRIVFEDGTTEDYNVTYKYKNTAQPTKMYGRVAMYKIDDLGIEYNYNRYIIKQDAKIVNDLVNYIKSLEYDKDLKSFVDLQAYDKRGYAVLKSYFNDVVRTEENAREFVMNLLSNVDGYSVTREDNILNYAINQKVINNQQFKKVLFAYNYYSRFYGIEMGGTTVSDVLLFKGNIYRPNITFNNVIDDFWNSRHKSAHVIYLEYRDNLGPLIGMNSQGDMIERAVHALTNYEDPNEWFTDYFGSRNLLTESAAKDYKNTVDYRAWTQIKKQPKYIMNILTLPKNTGFIVSAPGTFLVGSQMVYIQDPTDKTQQDRLLVSMKKFGDQIANFYNNVSGITGVSYLNKYADIQIDSINVNKYGSQSNGNCTDPFHKNFNDLLDEWFRASGASAYATDGVISYASPALYNYANFWTHEIGHNQSYKLFFKGNGFRPIGGNNNSNLGTEDYTDGHTTQSFGDGEVNWNLSYDFTPDRLVTTNLTQNRINSVEKIDSYYKGMYEAIDFLDYVEAIAFLKLTPEEQAKVAVQVQYPNANNHSTVSWKKITEADFKAMNLQTVGDLWDNRIAIRPGVTSSWTQDGGGSYGSEGMYIRRWYQPYNDNGRTHSYGFTYTAWQMLGMGGYENGYLTWFTGKSRTDLDAIKKITKDSTMTWEKFKQKRYELMENNFNTIPYIDAESLVQNYVEALKTDARNNDRNVTSSTNVRRINYHYLKRVTNDFTKDVLTDKNDAIHISTAEEFKAKIMENQIGDASGNKKYYIGNYVLDKDIDLSNIQSDGGTIIDGYFMGKLDGNGHKLIGNKVPIFNNIKFANISNLTIEDSQIQITDASNEKTGSLAKVVEYSTLNGIIAKNVNVSANKETGALVGNMTSVLAQDTHVTGVIVSGTNRVGAIAGYVDRSQMLECSANGEISATGNAVGAFVGEIVNKSVIKDCYSIGNAKGSNDVGGFIGYVNQSSIINCFSNAKAEGTSGIASFVGQTINNSTLKNNITLVNQFKGYKFDGRTGNDKFVNFSGNYENEGNVGTSTRERTTAVNFDGKIDIASEAQVKTENFYTETLKWNAEIWDFSKVSIGGIPKLRNSDLNDNSLSVKTYHIKTADEFVTKITEDPYARFVLDNDIDFASKNEIIDVEFRGILEGNNHKLIGNKVPIFNKLNKARITGVIIKGSKITSGQDNVGALAKLAINSEIENVHITEATITNANNKVGGIVGYAENSTLKASSSNASILAGGNDVGGLVGEITSSTIIENCYSLGLVQGNENVGGLVGNVIGSSIKYSYSATSVNGIHGIAGFIGQATENSTIENNVALGNQNKQYKFDGRTENEQFANYSDNYEYRDNRGKSTLSREGINFDGKIGVVTKEQISSKEFYTETLGWNESIWDLSSATNVCTPKLKNLDPNETKAIEVHKAEINSVEEFITELTAYPNGEFTIMTDLDFSSKEYTIGSVLIPRAFEGTIKGNGHTIRNLKNATIFEQFNGEVVNLNVEDFNYGAVFFTGEWAQYVSAGQSNRTQSNIAVFAKRSLNATYSNMKFNKITMFGHDNVAVVTSVDQNSTFEKINVSQAYLNTGKDSGGNKTSLFISEKTGGLIKNCYVHGEIFTIGKDNGGIIGISHGDVTIEEVISNVYASNKTKANAATNGLFIGKMDATTVIKNSASLGTESANGTGISKFVATIGDISKIQNCYENSSSNGTSRANGNNIIAVEKEQLKDKNFYINTLSFDETIWSLNNIEEKHYIESVNPHGMGRTEDFPLMIFFGLNEVINDTNQELINDDVIIDDVITDEVEELTNIALNKNITGSASQSGKPASNVVDGDVNSLWISDNGAVPANVSIDLDGEKYVDHINLHFEKAGFRFQFMVEVEDKDGNKTIVLDKRNNTGDNERSYKIPVGYNASKVHVTITGKASGGSFPGAWAALAEVEVMGKSAQEFTNIALSKNITGSVSQSGKPASNVVDGNLDSLWISDKGAMPANVSIDLDGEKYVDHINLHFEKAGFRFQFMVEVEDKDGNKTIVLDKRNNTGDNERSYKIPVISNASKIHVTITGKAEGGSFPGAWAALAEVEVMSSKQ
ncbi:ZmpA/ZmpB/ZmpC family metallo-endopeptidase-related protein [uncultured Clostridium sp.]|uniref:ZmpA/ZmpB/ZmpC family metallo-endopeptidase-related protein n=1 Tax=uncultured Clostridium sp. TaxID=59620 RepID=UPI00280B58FC|nr:ZmpA/ZmpB/ZmpC family metallo-endopeptidase-related protein [uncultured Clostridium sp.]